MPMDAETPFGMSFHVKRGKLRMAQRPILRMTPIIELRTMLSCSGSLVPRAIASVFHGLGSSHWVSTRGSSTDSRWS